jgi:sugar lactone lactonase YvrE
VDFDASGRAYVADTHNNRVAIYDIDGTKATLTGELSEKIRGRRLVR